LAGFHLRRNQKAVNMAANPVSKNINQLMKRVLSLLSFAILSALVTGCPYKDYTIDLKPQADGTIERTLTFFQTDDQHAGVVPITNSTSAVTVTNFEKFPSNELTAIVRLYPPGAVKTNGQCYVATGNFVGSMPADVGGVGSYTNFATSLGDAGFYMERFRGSNDLAGNIARRLKAADQIDDLIIGWSKMQFGREHGYKKLHKFLDEDFRQDLKNAALYAWAGEANDLYQTNYPNEFVLRFGQYLFERGYLRFSDTRDIYLFVENKGDSSVIRHLVRRLMMEKMGIPASDPVPTSFAVLGDEDALEKSCEKYLAGTGLYRAQIKQWQSETNANPSLAMPKASDAADELIATLFFGGTGGSFFGTPDHLNVKLALSHAPDFTNGKWEDGKVVWSVDLDPTRPLPVVCYAGWSTPNTQFQTDHFGGVILDEDTLSQYCYWRGTLGAEHAREWESFLTNLKPGPALKKSLQDFHFTGEAIPETIYEKDFDAYIGRGLLLQALPIGE
jgi:hypothetical protein